jgi:hypothetical protein
MGRQLSTWRGQGERFGTFTRLSSRIFFRRFLGGELHPPERGQNEPPIAIPGGWEPFDFSIYGLMTAVVSVSRLGSIGGVFKFASSKSGDLRLGGNNEFLPGKLRVLPFGRFQQPNPTPRTER